MHWSFVFADEEPDILPFFFDFIFMLLVHGIFTTDGV